MSTEQVTPLKDLQKIVEEKTLLYFTFPVLTITFQYRKPNFLQLSLNGDLPGMIADAVLEGFGKVTQGKTIDEISSDVAGKEIEDQNQFVKDVRESGYALLRKLCVSYKIMDVPTSDFENGILSTNDIPEEDAMAFFAHIVNDSRVSATEDGGEITADELSTFPEQGRGKKRSASRKNG